MAPPGGEPQQSTPSKPLSPSARQRIQRVFEHGLRCVENNDVEYANRLFSQCVVEDPASLLYLQSFLANLKQKFGGAESVSRFNTLRIKGHRSTLAKAVSGRRWEAAFTSGCSALGLNPWDVQTLMHLSEACRLLGVHDCRLYYLRWALEADPNNQPVNKAAAGALEDLGQFDQAIACWQRIRQVDPENEEAAQAIARLSVEKTITSGNYDSASLAAQGAEPSTSATSIALMSAAATGGDVPQEDLLKKAVESKPAEVSGYTDLADHYLGNGQIDEAEATLKKGLEVSGGGDLGVRERLEDVELTRARNQLVVAERRAAAEPTEEATELVRQMGAHANQVELEVYAARSDRDPKNAMLKLELGVRLKRAGKFKEAIPVLQAARPLESRRAQVLLDLGECFHRIEQYKLALNNYEESANSSAEEGGETHKLALYRAGVLATGLRELDLAERYLTALAGLDFAYKDVSERLDKIAALRNNL
ncbi:MAG: tetratricopeptide repeat protein [Planctomycetota bacterium]